jgi:outer membrane protein OmpA-like peptidoglycan-associated protein
MAHGKLFLTGIAIAAGGALLAGCSSTRAPNASLDQAKVAVANAQNDPAVRTTAPERLADAQEALSTAQTAYNDDEDKSVVDHNAYLAQRYAQIAMEAAKFRSSVAQSANIARVVTLPEVLFETGKSDLNPRGMQAVHDIASFMHERPDRSIQITGYTDSTGSAQLNAALSDARAASVKTALVSQGIPASRIETKGMGPANPVASNDTAAGRQQNRRVELTFPGAGAVGVGSSTP